MGMTRHRSLPVMDAEHAKRVAGVHVPRVSQVAAREELADITMSRGEGRGAGVQEARGWQKTLRGDCLCDEGLQARDGRCLEFSQAAVPTPIGGGPDPGAL